MLSRQAWCLSVDLETGRQADVDGLALYTFAEVLAPLLLISHAHENALGTSSEDSRV
jgi:hypothetical protein